MTDPSERSNGWRARVPRPIDFAELLGLSGLAIAQPILDLLFKNPQLFISWRTTVADLVILLVAVVVFPPLVVWLLASLVRLIRPQIARYAHDAAVGLFVAVLVAGVLRKVDARAVVVAVSIAAGIAGGYLRARIGMVRSFLRALAFAPAVFVALFLATSPVLDVVRNADAPTAVVTFPHPTRIVMIVFDEFPLTSLLDGHGNIDAQLYPNFARLSKSSTWYRNDTTVTPFTETAVPAILTGRYPKSPTTVPHISQYPQNLFTLLRGTYRLNVHESVTELCPASAGCGGQRSRNDVHPGAFGMIRDTTSIWRDFMDPGPTGQFDPSPLGAVDPDSLKTGEDFVSALQPTSSSSPELDFLHVLLPHFPWHYLPDGKDYNALPLHTLGLDGQNWSTPVAAQRGRQRHLLQVGAADKLLGEVLLRLIALHAYDNTMLIVTADHGVSFQSGLPIRGVAPATYPDIMWTPLFVKYPNQHAGAGTGPDDRVARSIDIVPTIVDALGAKMPWPVDGRSLLLPPRPADVDAPRRLLDWSRNLIHPKPGTGKYLDFNGVTGYASVLRARAAPGNVYDRYRLYRIGPDGALVGKQLAASVVAPPPAARPTISLDQLPFYVRTSAYADKVPWVDAHGWLDGPPGSQLIITLDGVVAGSYETTGGTAHHSEYWGVLPPWLFRLGRTNVAIYQASGTGAARRFTQLTLVP